MDRYDDFFKKMKRLAEKSVEDPIREFSPIHVEKMFDVIHSIPFYLRIGNLIVQTRS